MPEAEKYAENKFLYFHSPLGKDKLLLRRFSGTEAISTLFSFQIEAYAMNEDKIEFDKLLGQKIAFGLNVSHDGLEERHFSGIVSRISQGGRGKVFTVYFMEVVPEAWMLTRVSQSRIFQEMTVPEVLKAVMKTGDVKWELQGQYEKRNYVTQYQESDWDFAQRLMEEEGIHYFFKFPDRGQHQMIVADKPQSNIEIPHSSKVTYEELMGGQRGESTEERVSTWEKAQRIRPGKVTLWDHNFQLPHRNLEANKTPGPDVKIGTVNHKRKLGFSESLEVYSQPGEFSWRFDGIDKGGGERASDLQKIFEDNKRTAEIRMGEQEAWMFEMLGSANHRHFTAGHKFTLDGHYDADDVYLLVTVTHSGEEALFRSGGDDESEDHYGNTFTAIPYKIPFRPERTVPRPRIYGPQTAVVVGPSGEEIFTDKYGRVKVHFHWDRDGTGTANDSLWVRVATPVAGKNWGFIAIPRIGHEVIVSFIGGDPDRPIITGSVYNADQMPSYQLPDNKTRSGIKTNSTPGSGGFNEIRFEDKSGEEQVFVHAQKNYDLRVKKDFFEHIEQDFHQIIDRHRIEHVKTDSHHITGGNSFSKFKGDYHADVSSNSNHKVGGSYSLDVTGGINIKSGQGITLEAPTINIKGAGSVTIGAATVTLNGSGTTIIKGGMVMINSGAASSPSSASCSAPTAPKEAQEADKAEHGGMKSYSWQARQMAPIPPPGSVSGSNTAPRHKKDSEENKQKKSFIEIELVDDNGKPVPGEPYRILLPDGSVAEGSLNDKGFARVDGIDPGTCKVTFPRLDRRAWEDA